jgi:hypothetical protein
MRKYEKKNKTEVLKEGFEILGMRLKVRGIKFKERA